MDRPLRDKLLIAFLTVALISGGLSPVAGVYLLNSMVIQEAQRRVSLGLKTARAMLDHHADELGRAAAVTAQWLSIQSETRPERNVLAALQDRSGGDYLDIIDSRGRVIAAAHGCAVGLDLSANPLVKMALSEGRMGSGIRIADISELAAESPELAAEAYITVIDTPRAKPGGPKRLREALVVEAICPITRPGGKIIGAVRVGMILNRNYELVDFIRDNIFTFATYKGNQLGTVTIFLRDVRVATNVIGPNGERAIGTRVSAEVYDKVLGEGGVWIGPAFVVDNWYMSAYEPIHDPTGKTIGILYVGVLQERYDDMRRRAIGVFLGIVLFGLVVAAGGGTLLAGRITRRLSDLTAAASQIAQGNLQVEICPPSRAQRDEINCLKAAFCEMVRALKERDEELRRSHERLERTAEELRRWNQNYLDTLEFITHELKNQVAAMKLNLLAVRDGFVGELSPEQRAAIEDVVQAVNRTEDMILNYLNLSRIEKGELQVRAQPVQVAVEVVAPVVRDFSGQFADRGMKMEVDVPEDLIVEADPSLLQIVFENLLSNAAKYGREGGLVRVWARRTDGYVEFHVWNEGEGVLPEQTDDLFQKFARLEGGPARARGTGLGLFITREIIRNHGGDIRAEGEYGKWIDFIFTLPRHDVVLIGAGEESSSPVRPVAGLGDEARQAAKADSDTPEAGQDDCDDDEDAEDWPELIG